MRGCVWLLLLLAGGARGGPPRARSVRLWSGGPREYSVLSELTLSDAAGPSAARRAAGWRLAATLAVWPAALDDEREDALLHFQLESPELQLRGASARADWAWRPSLWDAPAQRSSQFAARWTAGRLQAAWLDPTDPPPAQDFKRALLSLFQFQILDGEYNETDVSGACTVQYETLAPHEFRKIKRGCTRGAAADGEAGVTSRRVARYTLRPALDALQSLHAEEVHALAAAGGAAVKARAWLRLQLQRERARHEPAPARGRAALQAALQALPAALQPAPLQQPVRPAEEDEEEEDEEESEREEVSLESAAALQLCALLAGAEPGRGGRGEQARALLQLLPAARRAAEPQLQRLAARALQHSDAALLGAARLLGACGTAAAAAAAHEALQLAAGAGPAALQLARAYLQALALSAQPAEAAVRGALQLARGAQAAAVRDAALLAAAAAAPRVSPDLATHTRDELARQLARCKEEECRSVRLLALGNLRRQDTAELLLEHAERGGSPRAAGAALAALRLAAPRALPLERLLRLALDMSRPLELRAAALDLAATRSARLPLSLAEAARALAAERGGAAHELRRVLWQRLRELSAQHEPARDFLRAAARDPQLGTWDARAHAGTSSVLTREAGLSAEGWAARLDSRSVAAGGVARTATIALQLQPPAADPQPALPVLELELWTRGLQALTGAAPDGPPDAAQDEDAAAGLQLAAAGAFLPPLTLFTGQGELLGHVWAGTGSAPTAVLRALLALRPERARRALLSGGELRLRTGAAAALALDAHASVSLWARTAAARVTLRAALADVSSARVAPGWGRARVTVRTHAPARLRIASDLDFYSGVALCVRADVANRTETRAARLRSELGARRWRVRHAVTSRRARPGRTLALGRDNDAACRTLAAPDSDADEPDAEDPPDS